MPNAGDEYTARILKAFKLKLEQRLRDPLRLMNRLGALALASSQEAFDSGEFGSYRWPRRYPQQGEGDNFVNIAGIVADFQQGIDPPQRRFQARPPLLDKGYLRRTLKDKSTSLRLLDSHTIRIGTTVPYARHHQWGGQTEEFITDNVRNNLKNWLKGGPQFSKKVPTKKVFQLGQIRRKAVGQGVKRDAGTGYIGTLSRRERYGKKLGFLFRSRVLITRVAQRPFVGVTPEVGKKMIQATVDFFEKR